MVCFPPCLVPCNRRIATNHQQLLFCNPAEGNSRYFLRYETVQCGCCNWYVGLHVTRTRLLVSPIDAPLLGNSRRLPSTWRRPLLSSSWRAVLLERTCQLPGDWKRYRCSYCSSDARFACCSHSRENVNNCEELDTQAETLARVIHFFLLLCYGGVKERSDEKQIGLIVARPTSGVCFCERLCQ